MNNRARKESIPNDVWRFLGEERQHPGCWGKLGQVRTHTHTHTSTPSPAGLVKTKKLKCSQNARVAPDVL